MTPASTPAMADTVADSAGSKAARKKNSSRAARKSRSQADRKPDRKSGSDGAPLNEQTRYRVTGSLFLLAIAVIVLPMLFDGAGLEPLELEPLDVPRAVPDVPTRASQAPVSDFVARADELRATVDDEGFQQDAAGTRIGEPVLTEPDETTRVWAVQVASFGEEENALKLRDRLRAEDREAFISTVRQDDETLRRVAVGPLLDRAEADGLRQELAAALGISDVRVVAFSN